MDKLERHEIRERQLGTTGNVYDFVFLFLQTEVPFLVA